VKGNGSTSVVAIGAFGVGTSVLGDHLGPFLGFVCDELAELGGRANQWCGSQVGKPCLDLRIDKTCIDLLLSLPTIPMDVFLGTPIPFQPLASKPGTKSPIVGMPGNTSRRAVDATPSARSLRALMCSMDDNTPSKATCT
jgi:hypothetical protein